METLLNESKAVIISEIGNGAFLMRLNQLAWQLIGQKMALNSGYFRDTVPVQAISHLVVMMAGKLLLSEVALPTQLNPICSCLG